MYPPNSPGRLGARPASRDGSEPMAMHKISSVPAAGHGSGLVRSGVAVRPRP